MVVVHFLPGPEPSTPTGTEGRRRKTFFILCVSTAYVLLHIHNQRYTSGISRAWDLTFLSSRISAAHCERGNAVNVASLATDFPDVLAYASAFSRLSNPGETFDSKVPIESAVHWNVADPERAQSDMKFPRRNQTYVATGRQSHKQLRAISRVAEEQGGTILLAASDRNHTLERALRAGSFSLFRECRPTYSSVIEKHAGKSRNAIVCLVSGHFRRFSVVDLILEDC